MKRVAFTTGLAIGLAGLATVQAAAPIEKSGPCPTLQRTNIYNGINVMSFNNASSSSANLASPSPGWPIRPPQALRDQGLIQEPLSPQQSINCVLLPPGLKPQIIASELTPGPAGMPSMAYLMHFTFDERGRMWAVEPRDYPYTHDSTGMPAGDGITTGGGLPTDRLSGKGRVLILEDNDGDGSLDNFKVFYTGLALPTSIEVVKNGVIVSVPPNIYYIEKSASNPDTAGSAPVVVVNNMGSSSTNYDTHGQPNSLTRGLDNWIYGHTGYNGCGGSNVNIANAPGGSSRSGSCGNGYSYRFKHSLIGSDTSRFEARSSGPANAHGLGMMEDGQLFKAGATGTPHINHDVRPGQAALDIRNADGGTGSLGSGRLFAMTNDRYMWEGNNNEVAANPVSGNVLYYSSGSSAVSGLDFYTARLLPPKYWNRFAFACEGMSGLCNQDSLVVDNSTWSAYRLNPTKSWPNIFASTDAWAAPLKVRTGPDGALWVLDWYNYVFLHNPAGPATNGAYRHPLRYKSRVRMYRIVPENGNTDPVLNLSNATTRQLVHTLYNSNQVWRMQAQRLLIEKGYNEELGNLLDSLLTYHHQVDAVGIDGPVLHAIWTLNGLKQFEANPTRWDPILRKLLLHPSWTVRRNVLLAMPATAASYESIRTQCAVNDQHPHVRLQALENLSRIPASGAVIESMDGLRTDTYLTGAFTSAGASKVVTATGSARPASCPAYQDTATYYAVSVQGNHGAPLRFRADVRFEVRAGGFDLVKNAELPSGELVVYDLRGKAVFRTVWNKAAQNWSKSQVRDLSHPVYFYNFRGFNGQTFNGRIPLSSI